MKSKIPTKAEVRRVDAKYHRSQVRLNVLMHGVADTLPESWDKDRFASLMDIIRTELIPAHKDYQKASRDDSDMRQRIRRSRGRRRRDIRVLINRRTKTIPNPKPKKRGKAA